MMITPIVDPVVDSMLSPAAYPEPPLPGVLVDIPVPVAESSPWQGVADSPVRECSPSFHMSPVGFGYGSIPSPMSPSSHIIDGHGPPSCMATMDQYLPRMGTPFGGGGGGVGNHRTLLPRPLTPHLLVEVMVVESTVDCSTEESVAVCPPSMPDLSREGPFDVHQVTTESGASPRVLDSLPAVSIEYVGALESARLLNRTPECWLDHMGREHNLAAALQLQHHAGLVMSNIQVLGQFVTSLN